MTTTTNKLAAGVLFPALSWPAVARDQLAPAKMDGWRMLVVYRGKHCPLCRKYLGTLESLREDYAKAGIEVAALSADSRDKAVSETEEESWKFPVGYDLSVEQMKQLGLYVSSPRSPEETDRPFAEPAVFVINPKGNIQIVDVSNAPFSRPDLASLLDGLKFVIDKDYPVRGTLA